MRALSALRGLAVTLGGSIALDGAAAASARSVLRAARRGRAPRPAAMAGVAATLLYALAVRPWMLHWGATASESDAALPGDELAPLPGSGPTRAVTVDAPPARVWPWLAQVGMDRGGFYSYALLENLAGCRVTNASRIHPEWQHRDIGEKVMLHPLVGLEVGLFEPGRTLVLTGWGAFVLQPIEGGRTRLLARAHGRGGVLERAYNALLMEIPHFLMERRMLLGIKQRAERAERAGDTAENHGHGAPEPDRTVEV